MKMKKSANAVVLIMLIVSQVCSVLTLESTSPAFMWSPHVGMELKETVNYQTLSSKDLARSVMAEGGWSNLLCEGRRPEHALDIAVVFVGKELHSLDVSGKNTADATLVDLLKDSFTKSNFSMAYPYVSAKVKEGTLESSLVEEFEESCEHRLRVNNIIVSESCSLEGKGHSKLADMQSFQEYVSSTMEKGKGQPDLFVLCHGGLNFLKRHGQPHSEGDVVSELISSLDHSGAKYAILYVSDPYNPIQVPSSHQIGRLLAEASPANGSLNSTRCDGVCQVKTSLLEGVLVALVLLIILICGLCCMMGIDTPTRFETPQESS